MNTGNDTTETHKNPFLLVHLLGFLAATCLVFFLGVLVIYLFAGGEVAAKVAAFSPIAVMTGFLGWGVDWQMSLAERRRKGVAR